MVIFPPFLTVGDTIAIISTARKISKSELSTSVSVFESWGLRVVFAPNLFEIENQFAGSDAQRLADLQWALDHPEISAIICARGGYGTSRLIDDVDLTLFAQNPKWVVGFSDVTVLLSHLLAHNFASIHGIMPILFIKDESAISVDSLRQILFGQTTTYHSEPHELNALGVGEGIVFGGNLSILHHLIGTNSEVDWAGKILFIEDLDEYLYHIDRMMNHFKRSGKFAQLAGLIVGHFSDMKDNAVPFGSDSYAIIANQLSDFNFPICFGFPIGHAFDNLSIICGQKMALVVDQRGAKLSPTTI